MARCEDFPCCGHYDEGGPERGIPYCPDPNGGRSEWAKRLYGDDPSDPSDPDYGREYGCPDGAHEFMTLSRECGAMVCEDCDHHTSLRGTPLARCFCGWSASGGDGRRELVEMGEHIEEDW